MQPWNFIIIHNLGIRKKVYDHFREVNDRAAKNYENDLNVAYRSLKLQGILDSPLNLLVTCDTKRGGPHVLGRATIPETDVYSTCLAIENFWLAARAEGVGVGWMSLHDPQAVARIFELPKGVIPIAYLTVGYPLEFPAEPLLQSVGWRERLELDKVIFYETWGLTRDASNKIHEINGKEKGIGGPIGSMFVEKQAVNEFAVHPETNHRMENLTKPKKSLGLLEDIVLKLSGIQNRPYPKIENKTLILMAGDHGVAAEGVSAYKKEITTRMVYQFVAGAGAVNSIARQNGISVHIVDMGVDHDFQNATGIIHCKIRRGSRNLAVENAMTTEETRIAMDAGRRLVREICGNTDILLLGEMGIGNSTSAAALVAAYFGISAAQAAGVGTGIGPRTLNKKVDIVQKGLDLHHNTSGDPLKILAAFGGYEIAGLTGAILEAFELRIPVLLDGFITGASALAASRFNPEVCHILFAAHKSREPAHALILQELKLAPILDLGMGLGEGSGAALAMNLIETASRILREMRTFEEAGIEDPLEINAQE